MTKTPSPSSPAAPAGNDDRSSTGSAGAASTGRPDPDFYAPLGEFTEIKVWNAIAEAKRISPPPIRCVRAGNGPWHALRHSSESRTICDRLIVKSMVEERRDYLDIFPPENETCPTCYRALTWVVVRW